VSLHAAVAVTALALGGGAVWLTWSWFWPFKRCPGCLGRQGRGRLSTAGAYNRCRRCRGTPGEQVRVGARLVSKVTGRPVRDLRRKK
jgi:hypothetical protein